MCALCMCTVSCCFAVIDYCIVACAVLLCCLFQMYKTCQVCRSMNLVQVLCLSHGPDNCLKTDIIAADVWITTEMQSAGVWQY